MTSDIGSEHLLDGATHVDKSPTAAAREYALDAALEVLPQSVSEGLRQTPSRSPNRSPSSRTPSVLWCDRG